MKGKGKSGAVLSVDLMSTSGSIEVGYKGKGKGRKVKLNKCTEKGQVAALCEGTKVVDEEKVQRKMAHEMRAWKAQEKKEAPGSYASPKK